MSFTILQINSTCNWGSTGVIAEDLGNLIINNGGNSYIAYGRYSKESKSHLVKIGSRFSLYLHFVLSKIFDMHGMLSIIPTISFIRKVKKINPDLIHLHNIHGYYLNYRLLFNYFRICKKPIIWTLHDCWAYTGHCSYYSSKGCNKWINGCYSCPQKSEYPSSIIDNSNNNYKFKKNTFININNLYIVTVSQWLANEVSRSYLNKYSCKVIYNGIDTNIFQPYMSEKSTICSESKTLILGVANKWDNRKGLNDFILLSEKLSEDYHIHLVGLSKKQLSSLPSNGKITAVSRTSTVHELAVLYSTADVYINFSVEETLGMTNIESLACGTPIIVYNTTACPEIVVEGCGYVVDFRSFKSVIDILENNIRNKKHLYIDKCCQYARLNFAKEQKYLEYMHLYNELIRKN